MDSFVEYRNLGKIITNVVASRIVVGPLQTGQFGWTDSVVAHDSSLVLKRGFMVKMGNGCPPDLGSTPLAKYQHILEYQIQTIDT